MLAKLERGLRRVEKSLARPFRRRRRKPKIYLDHMDWDGLRALTGALNQDTSAFGPLTSVVATLSVCIDAFDDQARAYERYGILRTDLNDLFRALSDYFNGETNPSEATKSRILNLARGIEKETEPLNKRMEQNEVEQDRRAAGDVEGVLQGYRCVQTLLARFILNENTIMWKTPGEEAPDTHLDRLPHPAAAWYNSVVPGSPRRNGCTPNTRVGVLKELKNWAIYNNHPKLYWLNGTAGTGKTTIAYSLCEHLENSSKLAASFFCARWSPECRDARTILPSISHQLSSFSRPFRSALSDSINGDVDVQTLPIDEQFELLIAAPLQKVGFAFPVGATIVIDALNECEDGDGADQILSALLAHASELPVRFFIAGCPEPEVVDHMHTERGGGAFLEKNLDEIAPSAVRADIQTYIGAELATTNPSPDNLEYLCELSGALFERAAAFVRYVMRGYLIGGTERTQRMQRLLGAPTSPVDEGDEQMDAAYSAFLEAALEVDTVGGPDRAETNRVLHTIICAREPLTVRTLAGLLGMGVARLVGYPLQALRLVLQVSNTSGLVSPRHASFSKYLLDQERSGGVYCDANQHNVWLANTCFDLVRVPRRPHSNDDFKASYPRGRGEYAENGNVNTAVRTEILYAYRHWAAHLKLVGPSKASAITERLKQELGTSTSSEVDDFFNILLQAAQENSARRSSRGDDIILLLHTVVCAQQPLTVGTIARLSMIDPRKLRHLLVPVLQTSGTTGLVTVLHRSFLPFMLDQKRSGRFHCDARKHNAWFAGRCFETMKVPNPPFNICDLPSSYLLDREVPDLEERVERAISPELLYVCRYWEAHLSLASPIEDLLDALHEFLSTRLLLWMEILNLNGRIIEGANALYNITNPGYDR